MIIDDQLHKIIDRPKLGAPRLLDHVAKRVWLQETQSILYRRNGEECATKKDRILCCCRNKSYVMSNSYKMCPIIRDLLY